LHNCVFKSLSSMYKSKNYEPCEYQQEKVSNE